MPKPSTQKGARRPSRSWPAALVLTGVSVLVFAGAAKGALIWDDQSLLSYAPRLQRADFWKNALTHDFMYGVPSDRPLNSFKYRPVITLIEAVESLVWGPAPLGYHLVNLVLHAGCVLLAWRWLRRRLGSDGPSGDVLLAATVGAVVFAVHPTRVESVAWISGCTDLWMTLAVLAGLTLWDRTPTTAGAAGTGLLLALAFYCKETALAVPVALVIDQKLRTRDVSGARWLALATAPSLALAWRLGVVPLTGVQSRGPQLPLFSRVVTTLWQYIEVVVWPWPASTQRGYQSWAFSGAAPSVSSASVVCGVIAMGSATGLCIVARRRPAFRSWLADLVWFVVPLLPALNFFPLSDVFLVTERQLYLPGLGVSALVARAALRVLPSARLYFVAGAAGALLVLAWGIGSAIHAGHFASSESLWSYELAARPDDIVALDGLYNARVAERRFDDAKGFVARALRITAAPEDKALELSNWLEADFRQAFAADELLWSCRVTHDRIAMGAEPDGPLAELYAGIAPEGRAWLRQDVKFRIRRAWLAIATGDFGEGAAQVEQLEHDVGVGQGTLHPLIVALVAAGDLAAATSRLQQAQGDPDAPRLAQMVAMARTAEAKGVPTSVEGRTILAHALMANRDILVARLLIRDALSESPESVPLLGDEVSIEVGLHRTAAAREDITRLRDREPRLGPQLDVLLRKLSDEEQAR